MTDVDTKHPTYADHLESWQLMSDAYAGEATVKAAGRAYLPATGGQTEDWSSPIIGGVAKGQRDYEAYKARAVFHDVTREAVQAACGTMHRKPASIEVPEPMRPLLDRITQRGESAEGLLRRVNQAQLLSGRIGLLAGLPGGERRGKVLPYISTYSAASIINWGVVDGVSPDGRDSLRVVVLDESGPKRNGLEWEAEERFRVLLLGSLDGEGGQYLSGVFVKDAKGGLRFDESAMAPPVNSGLALDHIPFVFAGPRDIAPDIDQSPLLGLGRLAMAIYRGEADYRQTLYMQGQATPVFKGADMDPTKPQRLGAGGGVYVSEAGDFYYAGVPADGIAEQRSAIENDLRRAAAISGQNSEATTGEAESGTALRVRQSASRATLVTVALAGGAALQESLRSIAIWMSLDPEEVIVSPNLDFTDTPVDGNDWDAIMKAKKGSKSGGGGMPVSYESLHALAKERGVAQFDFETEMEKIEAEKNLPAFKQEDPPPAANDVPQPNKVPPDGAA